MQFTEDGGHRADNDNTRYRGGYPAIQWLGRQEDGPALARAVLVEIGDATVSAPGAATPSYLDPREPCADDTETHAVPDQPVSVTTMADTAQDGPDEVWPETLHEISPSERDTCRALGWIEWPNSRLARSEPIGWCMRCSCGRMAPTDGSLLRPEFDGEEKRATLAGMTFSFHAEVFRPAGGTMVLFTDRKGRERQPAYRASKPRGGKRPHRTESAVRAYLDTKPCHPSPMQVSGLQRAMSDEPAIPPMYDPLMREAPTAKNPFGRFGVEEARAVLRDHGIDGSVSFEKLPFPATRGDSKIAKGARFIGGIKGRKLTASVPAPSWQIHDPKSLPPALEIAASRGTLADIGEAVRDKSKPAPVRLDRLGKRVLLAEARALVAANDNISKKLAA